LQRMRTRTWVCDSVIVSWLRSLINGTTSIYITFLCTMMIYAMRLQELVQKGGKRDVTGLDVPFVVTA